jgi:GNAT superfamily N-acetyltransferase
LVPLADTVDLRHRVLRPGQPVDNITRDDDPTALQVGALVAGEVLACANVRPGAPLWAAATTDCWRLRGVATDPAHRRQGLAGAVVTEACRLAAERGAALIWCNARLGALGLYEHLGWLPHGPVFELPDIGEHQVRWRPL